MLSVAAVTLRLESCPFAYVFWHHPVERVDPLRRSVGSCTMIWSTEHLLGSCACLRERGRAHG